jgi:hypothetical protein
MKKTLYVNGLVVGEVDLVAGDYASEIAAGYGVDPAPSADGLRQFVSELNTAFVDWRYCYETGSVTEPLKIPPTIVVMVAVDQAAEQIVIAVELLVGGNAR